MSLIRQKAICRDRDFYWNSNTVDFPVRNRSDVESQSLRKPELLPPVEIRAAILQVVNASFGVIPEEVIPVVARALGFATTSPTLRETIDRQITASIQAGDVVERNNKLFAKPG